MGKQEDILEGLKGIKETTKNEKTVKDLWNKIEVMDFLHFPRENKTFAVFKKTGDTMLLKNIQGEKREIKKDSDEVVEIVAVD